MSDHQKDIEILALRHQPLVLQRQVGKPALTDTDRAVLASLLHHLPIDKLRQHLLLEDLARETNVDTAWLAPLHDLVRRAAEAGHGDHSISALTEVLRKSARQP
ncbi:hypothetical protein AB0392_10695 [Nonomuraea angiospora]|uniref:imine reductase family protein n=1 Tax=Nonomuraea angiospora TaxID=46172 RepID=UPI00344FD9A1